MCLGSRSERDQNAARAAPVARTVELLSVTATLRQVTWPSGPHPPAIVHAPRLTMQGWHRPPAASAGCSQAAGPIMGLTVHTIRQLALFPPNSVPLELPCNFAKVCLSIFFFFCLSIFKACLMFHSGDVL